MSVKLYSFVGKVEDIQAEFPHPDKDGKKKILPLQQRLILKAAADLGTPAKGADIVKHAIDNFNLSTRQRPEVLYAWYARSNEALGFIKESNS